MSTLGGLFGSQPRSKRNFLLENIRDVCKEQLKKKSENLQMVKLGQYTRYVPQPILKLNEHQTTQSKRTRKIASPSKDKTSAVPNSRKQIGSLPKGQSESGSQTTCQLHSLCRHSEGSGVTDCSQEDVIPFKYIDEENVPFRWTQVCPSLISHTVCHQSVQTLNEDDLDSLLEDGSIKYPSSDKIQGNVKDENVMLLEWPVNGEDDSSPYPPEREISSGSIMSKPKGQALTLPVDDTNRTQQNVSYEDRRLAAESSGKHFSVNDHGDEISASQRSHYPLSSKTNGQEITRRYRSQSIGSKNLKTGDADSVERRAGGRDQSMKPILQLRDEIENLGITSLKSNGLPARPPTSYQKGVIPKYLAKRINEQKAISRTTESNEVNTSEMQTRIELQEATKAFDALIAELNKMPVRTDTLRTKLRKIEIEKELNLWERRIRSLTKVSDF